MSDSASLRPPLVYQEALLKIARLPTDRAGSLDEALGWVTTIASEAVQCERVGIWWYTPDRSSIRCLDMRQRSTGAHARGIRLNAADYPDYFNELAHARALVAHDACQHPGTRCFCDSYLNPLGITSMLDAPIFRAGVLAGVVCHEHIGPPRRWTDDEVRFAASVADLAALVVEHWENRQAADALTRQEQRLRQAETLEALGRMTGGVAHDFNNLLTSILGYGQMIAQRGRDLPGIAEPAGKLVGVAERAAELTRQLLSFSRNHELALEPLAVDDVVKGMDHLLRPLLKGPYRLDLMLGGPGPVLGDATHLVRAVLNLVINARDAMPDGGPIMIRTSERTVAAGEVVAVEGGELTPGRWAAIAVSDQGIGMDSSVRSHLFEPFFTTKPREYGTGLGLSSVWNVVQNCHGRIQVDSAPGKGTTMTILLPRIAIAGGSS